MPMQLDARKQLASRCKMQLDARGVASRCRITPRPRPFCTRPPGGVGPHKTAHTTRDNPTHTSTGSGKRFSKSLRLHRIARFALVGVGVVRLLVAARRRAFVRVRLMRLGAVERDVGRDDLFVALLEELVQPVVADRVVLGELCSEGDGLLHHSNLVSSRFLPPIKIDIDQNK